MTRRRVFDPRTATPAFWRREQVQEALARRDVAKLFRTYLAEFKECTQTQLALLTEHDRSDVSNWVRGTRHGQVSDINVLTRIAEGLRMPDSARMLMGLAPADALISSIRDERELTDGDPGRTDQAARLRIDGSDRSSTRIAICGSRSGGTNPRVINAAVRSLAGKIREICVTDRPYVLLSVAASIDGYIDDNTDQRLLLSNDEDFDRVDEVRSGVDAILVGANTIRRDNPRLLVRSQQRRNRRRAAGLPESPLKVTLSAGGDLDPASKFFTEGDIEKIVYVPTPAVDKTSEAVGQAATIVGAGDPLELALVLDDLGKRGVRRLMVEGGGTVHTQLLSAGLVDEIHLVIAPFFVGDACAPSFVSSGTFPQNPSNRMNLAEVRQIGDVVLLRYLPKAPANG